MIRSVVAHFEGSSDFSWKQVMYLKQNKPWLFTANAKYARNAGVTMGKGQKL